MSLMEQEKARRMEMLPKLRPADQIDISEEQLVMLKEIFDSLPIVEGTYNSVSGIDFFSTIRKHPQMRAINTAIAREPDGESRIPRETF